MKVVLFGAPSVGKGTYASRLKEIYGIPHISTGDLFRENIKNNTELGTKAKEFMDAGNLVPDELTINMLKERIQRDDCKAGFLLDGFPRTIAQAEALDSIVELDRVINFYADEQVILDRVSGRRICKNCGAIFHLTKIPPKVEGVCDRCGGELYQRPDEKPDIVQERLKIYKEKTMPVLNYYEKKGILSHVDGNIDIADPKAHIIEDCRVILDKIKEEN